MDHDPLLKNHRYCDVCKKKEIAFGCGSCGKRWYCSWKCRSTDFFLLFHWARCDMSID